MTKYLYMPDIEANYIREFDARITERGEGYVVLDRTAFYPEGGGQPSDVGVLRWDGGNVRVIRVQKKGGRHFIDGDIPEKEVHGILDWEPRHAHMRMHTAQHVISGVVYDLFKARTVGNQIHAGRSRVDFAPAHFSEDDLKAIEDKCNEIIARNAPVKIYTESRESLEARVDSQRANLYLLPEFVKQLRIIDIEGFDVCPCAGTHVRNTSELGRVHVLGRRTKGKDKERVEYELVGV